MPVHILIPLLLGMGMGMSLGATPTSQSSGHELVRKLIITSHVEKSLPYALPSLVGSCWIISPAFMNLHSNLNLVVYIHSIQCCFSSNQIFINYSQSLAIVAYHISVEPSTLFDKQPLLTSHYQPAHGWYSPPPVDPGLRWFGVLKGWDHCWYLWWRDDGQWWPLMFQ